MSSSLEVYESDDRSDNLCGIGSWKPKWVQRFVSPKYFLVILGLTSLIQGSAFTFMVASVTTLEKRYAFSSRITGLILIADNVTELISCPVLGYFANRFNRPRMIGFCQLIVAFGCFIGALPYFIYGAELKQFDSESHINQTLEYCDSDRNTKSDCNNYQSNTVIPAIVLLCLSSAANGIGFTAFFIIGYPFIDDNVDKRDSAIYLSIVSAMRLCGPTLGFLLSSFCLTFYENPFIDPGISDLKDPRWIGAWWMGFVIIGLLLIVTTAPIFLYPPSLKKLPHNQTATNDKDQIIENYTDLWPKLVTLMKNPIFVCYTLGATFTLIGGLGFLTFKAKYIESEYKKSASEANFFSGAIGIVPVSIGLFLGGLFIRIFKPSPRVLTIFITIAEAFGFIGVFAGLFLGCPVSPFDGIQNHGQFQMKSLCNYNCECTQTQFTPICSSDGKTNYFSPCFANCNQLSSKHTEQGIIEYSQCECFSGTAKSGYCDNNCNTFPAYITLLGVSNVLGSLARTGNSIIAMRIVEPKDKSFSLGIAGFFWSLFAFIPYPLVFGAITDAACLVWEESCGQRGNCWIYDSNKFRNYLHGTALLFYITGTLFDIIVVLLSKRIKNLYDDENVETEKTNLKIKFKSKKSDSL